MCAIQQSSKEQNLDKINFVFYFVRISFEYNEGIIFGFLLFK